MYNKNDKIYQERVNTYSLRAKKIKKELNLLVVLRLLVFLLLAYGTYMLTMLHIAYGAVFFILFTSLFIFLIRKHLKRKEFLTLVENIVSINKQEIEALRGNLKSFDNGSEFSDPAHEFSKDLEIFGEKNLFQYLNRTSTYAGKNQLASWLTQPLRLKVEIEKRQQTVKELKDRLDWRQHFKAIGQSIDIEEYDDARLVAWAKEGYHLPRESFLRLFIYVSPLLVLAGLTLYFTGVIPAGYPVLLMLANRIVLYRYGRNIVNFHLTVTNQLKVLKNYSRLLRHIEKQSFQSQNLTEQQNHFTSNQKAASERIGKLYRLSDALDNSGNLFVNVVLNTIFLYSIHQVFRIEKWHQRNASDIEKWIKATGCFDAYNSLANYYFNNPGFPFPVPFEKQPLQARALGHPLINPEKRISNDFQINEKGEVYIITGANMAGKSTFLRTIGVNLVLAMAGAPVCAAEMHFSITNLFTSMNITDSLSMNESYFYAEVKRLRQLIDKASTSEQILVLLDEILTGTNTRDKEIASKAFLERLVGMQVTSIIATHDLSLTSLEKKYPEKIKNKSFEVDLVGDKMEYDYAIREGVAKNMNALELLKSLKLIP